MLVKRLLVLAFVNPGETENLINPGKTESEKLALLATMTRREGGGHRLWPFCKASTTIEVFRKILPVAAGKKLTDAR